MTVSVQGWLDQTDKYKRFSVAGVIPAQVNDTTKRKMSASAKRRWQDPNQRSHLMKKRREQFTDETRAKLREKSRQYSSDPVVRAKSSKRMLAKWQDPVFRAKQKAIRQSEAYRQRKSEAVKRAPVVRWVTPVITPYGRFQTLAKAVKGISEKTGRRCHGGTLVNWLNQGRPGWRRLSRRLETIT